jgi:hypothetical protein
MKILFYKLGDSTNLISCTHEDMLEKFVPAAASEHLVVDESVLGEFDSEFLGAIDLSKGKLDISIPKAKELKKTKLRSVRAKLLADLDVAFMRALEASDSKKQAEIVSKKEELRNITQLVDSAKTLKQIKAISID